MGDRNLINTVKKASVMTVHGYKKAVGMSEKPAEWIKMGGEEAYKSFKSGATSDQQSNLPDIRKADHFLLQFATSKIAKSQKKHKEEAEKYYKKFKEEDKDYSKLRKEIQKKYDLNKKDVRDLKKHYRENRELYSKRIGPLSERENYFINLVDKKDSARKLLAQRNLERHKARKRQAAVTALKMKSAWNQELAAGSSLSSDNLYEAGSKGVLGYMNNSVKAAVINTAKKYSMKLADKLTKNIAGKILNPLMHLKRYLIGLISGLIGNILTYILPFVAVFIIFAAVAAAVTNVAKSILSFFGLGGSDDDNSRENMSTYTDERIDELVAEREGLTSDQEELIRYALKQVGKEYTSVDEVNDGMSRTGPDSYDCSGLAYDVENHIGKNITAGSAAEQAELMMEQGKFLQDESVAPQVGDLIYYADPPDDVKPEHEEKWSHVYHVAIYVGNNYVVEAYGDSVGVIYGKLRSKNIFAICTP